MIKITVKEVANRQVKNRKDLFYVETLFSSIAACDQHYIYIYQCKGLHIECYTATNKVGFKAFLYNHFLSRHKCIQVPILSYAGDDTRDQTQHVAIDIIYTNLYNTIHYIKCLPLIHYDVTLQYLHKPNCLPKLYVLTILPSVSLHAPPECRYLNQISHMGFCDNGQVFKKNHIRHARSWEWVSDG